ncbi:MAG: serine/threonine-protein kinase, partial [Elusimicrobia bacterium]|nr:serine/threonine-protein kinase [Elusimicrobiota bacterium]
VGIHEIIEDKDELFLVLDYVEGRTLSAILKERQRFTLKECQEIFGHICFALSSAHQAKILHRDLKPSNIMFDTKGYIKILDFGLARVAQETSQQLTVGETSGTLAYMAPEQHLGHTRRASDIYALGVCLYELLTGELPFKGPDYLAQKERLAYVPPNFIAAYLPQEVEPFMASVLAPDPSKRVRDASEFSRLLNAL